jgi:hypothetical protein
MKSLFKRWPFASLVFVLLFIVIFIVCAVNVRVSVEVTDDTGAPISGALVSYEYPSLTATGFGFNAESFVSGEARTNSAGMANFNVPRTPGVGIKKEGYYSNGVPWRSSQAMAMQGKRNVLYKIRLSKIVRPVPMLVRRVDAKVPRQVSVVGFDLYAGDWVAPFGSGSRADLSITVTRVGERMDDFERTVQIMAETPQDGFVSRVLNARQQTNQLRLDPIAPLDGYVQTISWHDWVHASPERIRELEKNRDFVLGTHNPKYKLQQLEDGEHKNFIFRIRGATNRPLYGKIHGRFSLDEEYMQFVYYLNPTGERSLEWDMEHNLAGEQNVPVEP